MKWSILGRSCCLIMVGLTRESKAPLICLWVVPWTAAILHFPKMSSMDCGYPGTSPFASFIRMYLFTSASIDTIVGHPNMWDLKKLPYLLKNYVLVEEKYRITTKCGACADMYFK